MFSTVADWQFREHRIKPACGYLPAFPVGEQAAEDPCLLKMRKAKKWRAYSPRGKPQAQFASGPGSFPVPVANRRTNFSPMRAEGASDFTSRR
jgi:hypothetical protein